jgi:glycine/D-amino acid oxidase-like deaminating enzyme
VSDKTRLLIVGGGIIGSSLAWALARRGISEVTVVDLDLAGIYASSELNAGGARATWWQPVNIEACVATLAFFAEHAELFGFRRTGYLWLYEDPELYARALAKRRLQNTFGLEVEALRQADVLQRFPVVDRNVNDVIGATWSPHDGLLNPNAVRSFYRRSAEALGVRFRNRDYVTGVATALCDTGAGGSHRRVVGVDVIEVEGGGAGDAERVLREILTTHHVPLSKAVAEHRLECDIVVNCLGAWSPIFSAKIGVPDVTQPVRRQIALVDVHADDVRPGVKLEELGMLVDTSGLYVHAEGSHVLAGYSTPNEASGFDFAYDGEAFFTREIWPRLAHRSSSFERCGHVRGWAGLYAVTPDRSGIAGAVAGWSNLFEAHSFTGRGVMQSWAVGEAMAALIDTGRFESVDLSPLRRERFTRPDEWVHEALHI